MLTRKIITELHMPSALGAVAPLLRRMPKTKRKHSIRVAKRLNNRADDEHVWAALLHDYLERGGSLSELSQHVNELGLSSRILSVVRALSSEKDEQAEGNAVLAHLRSVIPTLDPEDANAVALVKLSDRIDNLRKRLRRDGKIGKNYRRKSAEVLEYLRGQYTGPEKWWNKLERKFVQLIS